MAGAGMTKAERGAQGVDPAAPAVVLIEPQLGVNIGMCARAMLNCGLGEMRIVGPRDGWPNPDAPPAASGATVILDNARIYETTRDAVADLNMVYATTARERDMTKRVVTGEQAAREIRALAAGDGKAGILFGKEASGLDNEDVSIADAVLNVPLNPGFTSLNLAQAVLLTGYAWRTAGDAAEASRLETPRQTRLANKEEMLGLFDHLERELDICGFLHPPEKAAVMRRNIRNALGRARMTEQEVRTFRGIVKALRRGPYPKKGPEKGEAWSDSKKHTSPPREGEGPLTTQSGLPPARE